jgi:hypothetical protein
MNSPRTEALAFRIWAYATPRGWDCTATEIADHLETSYRTVSVIARLKGWSSRLRSLGVGEVDYEKASVLSSTDAQLGGEGVRDYMRRQFRSMVSTGAD